MFEAFSISGPYTQTVAETNGVARTQCQDAQFNINSDGKKTRS